MDFMTSGSKKIYDMVYVAVFTVLMAVCSWISIPTVVPFTMQTFGVFAAVGILGGKRGTLSVLVYLVLGAIGVPVFGGFTGGIGILMGNTGGYIFGFLFSALLMWAMERFWGRKPLVQLISMAAGLLVCYVCGTAWFMAFYARTGEPMGLGVALAWCVLPFVIPDIIKIALAFEISRRLRRYAA